MMYCRKLPNCTLSTFCRVASGKNALSWRKCSGCHVVLSNHVAVVQPNVLVSTATSPRNVNQLGHRRMRLVISWRKSSVFCFASGMLSGSSADVRYFALCTAFTSLVPTFAMAVAIGFVEKFDL